MCDAIEINDREHRPEGRRFQVARKSNRWNPEENAGRGTIGPHGGDTVIRQAVVLASNA
jgi:hypothetical protein